MDEESKKGGDLEPLLRNANSSYNTISADDTYMIGINSTLSYKRRWNTIRVMYATMFCGSIGFSVVLTSLWPFLRKVDRGVSPTFLGFTNAIFSLAQLLASLLFGLWCYYRPSRESLYFSLLLELAGSALYVYAEEFPGFGKYIIFIARVFLGFSAGSGAVARTVVAQSTSLKERNAAMANLALSQAIGFIIGPVFSLACIPLGNKSLVFAPLRLHLNLYTAAGFVNLILALVTIVAMLCYFHEDKGNIYAGFTRSERLEAAAGEQNVRPDMVSVVVLNVIFFMNLSVFALNETIMTPFVMDEYTWTNTQAVYNLGYMLTGAGVLAVIVFIGIKPLMDRYRDHTLLSWSLLIILLGFVVYLPWGHEYPTLAWTSMKNQTMSTEAKISPEDALGCPSTYSWCFSTPKTHLVQYLVGFYLVGTGYPAAYVMITALYSKVVGQRPQGNYNGWIGAAGCLARVIGPLVVTDSFVHIGPRWTFLGVAIFIGIALSLSLATRQRLVPFHEYLEKRAAKLQAVT